MRITSANVILILLVVQAQLGSAYADPPAFPGAQGYGRFVSGGRGKPTVHVTNTNDAGPGSFREAVSTPGRTVVFDVGGYVRITTGQVHVASDIAIAGQTAPGDGIGILDSSVSLSDSHNVIVRYVRFRQGVDGAAAKQAKKGALNLNKARDIMLDHLSVQWGRWDTIDMTDCERVTVQNCIIGPGVAPQRFGCLCESDDVTFTHNLWVSNQSRNPKSKGKIQFANNVIYNWGVCGYVGGHSAGDHFADVVSNYFIAGPSSSQHFVGEFKPTDHLYQSGNFVDLDRNGALNGRPATADDFGTGPDAPTLTDRSPLVGTQTDVEPAVGSLAHVLASAGASLHRDAVDTRLVDDVRSFGRAGATVQSPADMGGAGDLKSGTPPTDSDGDGMPDAWERANGSNPADASDAAMPDHDGVTRLEQYLNSLCK